MDSKERASELLPCPFCGWKAVEQKGQRWFCQLHGEPNDPVVITCGNHKCAIKPTARASSQDLRHLAVRDWNTRAIRPAARVDGLREALERLLQAHKDTLEINGLMGDEEDEQAIEQAEEALAAAQPQAPVAPLDELKCDCTSYNGDVPPFNSVNLTTPGGKVVSVDKCIAEYLNGLWDAGIATYGSCCGHNGRFNRSVIVDTMENEAKAQRILGPTFIVWSLERPQAFCDVIKPPVCKSGSTLTERVRWAVGDAIKEGWAI